MCVSPAERTYVKSMTTYVKLFCCIPDCRVVDLCGFCEVLSNGLKCLMRFYWKSPFSPRFNSLIPSKQSIATCFELWGFIKKLICKNKWFPAVCLAFHEPFNAYQLLFKLVSKHYNNIYCHKKKVLQIKRNIFNQCSDRFQHWTIMTALKVALIFYLLGVTQQFREWLTDVQTNTWWWRLCVSVPVQHQSEKGVFQTVGWTHKDRWGTLVSQPEVQLNWWIGEAWNDWAHMKWNKNSANETNVHILRIVVNVLFQIIEGERNHQVLKSNKKNVLWSSIESLL